MSSSIPLSHRAWRWLLGLALVALAGAAGAVHWNSLGGPFGGQPLSLFIDPSGNTWAGGNGSGVYFRAAGTTKWMYRPDLVTQSNARFGVDAAGRIYVSGSGGLYMYSPADVTWVQVSGNNGLPNQAAGGLATDAGGTLYAAMNNEGVYKLAPGATTWTAVGTGLPPDKFANNLYVDTAGNLWLTLYGTGVYKLAAGASTWVAVNAGITDMRLLALQQVGNDLFLGIQFGGVFKLANATSGNTTWASWAGGALNAGDAVYAFARGADNTLYAAGYGFVYALPSGSNAWTKVGTGIEVLGPAFAIVYSSADGSLLLSNDSGVYVLPAGGTTWQASVDGMTASTIYGAVVAPNGDLYAATFGQGVQRLPSGAGTWSAVDPAHAGPVAQAIVIDGQGAIFISVGGGVMKLVNGAWTQAGTGQGNFAYTLAVDSADTLWAGQFGGVSKLASGTATWGAVGSGLPSSGSVTTLAVDSSGNAYAGIYGTGIYRLAAGDSTWTQLSLGLADAHINALASRGSAVYAGTGDGVYKLVAGVWQKVGTGFSDQVNAIAIDTNGDLYAGTEQLQAWRLAAGATAWTQIGLGLSSRNVDAFAIGGGRVYAGTHAMRGSPSGLYVLGLGDSVVEFYNTILDNFFITATAAEQAAILGGSAGPGWIVTGTAFSAGGAALVCRFYGSIVPGPNSHFYTINPVECQGLKDLQAITPASQKRWNFESNDFASTSPIAGQCPANMISVYRAYNNGFPKGIDSNHRITADVNRYLQQVAKGWIGEGVVMCAPR